MNLPPEMPPYSFDFDWDNRRVWQVDAPIEKIPVADLTWHLDVPIWTSVPGKPPFDFKPRSVLDNLDDYPRRVDRIRGVDLSYPIDLMWNIDRFVILDGVHRLARLVLEHQTTCYTRRIPRSAIPFISGITDTLPPAPGTLEIRRFQDSDLPAVKELHLLGLDQTGTHVGPGPWDDDLDDIRTAYLEDGGEFLVAVRDGIVIGMGALRRRSDEQAEIKRMRVHPDHQRQGIGRAIFAELETRASTLGYSRLFLDTAVQQIAAVRLYESVGFVEVGRTEDHAFECVLYENTLALTSSFHHHGKSAGSR